MSPILVHIWGPFSIHAYGALIALGACIAVLLAKHDRKLNTICSFEDFLTAVQIIIVFGYLGGRLLCFASEPWQTDHDFWTILKFWEPGLSIQGTIIGATLALLIFLHIKKINFFKFIDRVTLYAPLVQAFGRLGCFFAGCCYGQQTTMPWAIVYTDPDHMAPLHMPLHPTQLYSAMLLFVIFIVLYFYVQKNNLYPGTIFFLYLILVSAERFLVDFFRWDQTWIIGHGTLSIFSVNQWISLGIILAGFCGIWLIQKTKK